MTMGSLLSGVTRLSHEDIAAGHRTGKNLSAMLVNLRERETDLQNGIAELIRELPRHSQARKLLMAGHGVSAVVPVPAPPPVPPVAPAKPEPVASPIKPASKVK